MLWEQKTHSTSGQIISWNIWNRDFWNKKSDYNWTILTGPIAIAQRRDLMSL